MAHHHRHRSESSGTKAAESISRPMTSLFDKNDLAFLSLIKPLLSPNGQKIVDLVLIFSGNSSQENSLDLSSLLAQLNPAGENNPNPNLALLTSLLNSLNQKNKSEGS